MIIALILPKMLAALAQNPVGFMCREPLQRPQPFRGNHVGCQQHMHMIGHDNIRMEFIATEAALAGSQSIRDKCGNLRYAKICGTP